MGASGCNMGLLLFSVIAFATSIVVSGSTGGEFRRLTKSEFENLKEICGKSFISGHPRGSVQRIARGSLVRQGEFPWAVSFQISENNFYSQCSGTIISKYHIITAAHCVIENNTCPGFFSVNIERSHIIARSPCADGTIKDYLPSTNTQGVHIPASSFGRGCSQPVLSIKRIIVPQSSLDFRNTEGIFRTRTSDIAVLELEEPISDMEDELLPICIPSFNTKTPQSYTAYGFGNTENGYNKELWKLRLEGSVHERICTSGQLLCIDTMGKFSLRSGDGSVCGGDSGGALSGFVDGKEYLFGVLNSGSVNNCSWDIDRRPVNDFYFTRLAPYSDFLCLNTGVCPLGYDVYMNRNYAEYPEPVLYITKEDYGRYFHEGHFIVPLRKRKSRTNVVREKF